MTRVRKQRAEQAFITSPAPSQTVDRRAVLAKAAVAAGAAVDEATALASISADASSWNKAGAVYAAYHPETLLRIVEMGPHISPNLEAYATNIDGNGHHFDPVEAWMTDLEGEEAREAVREALAFERWTDAEEAALEATMNKAADGPDDGTTAGDLPEEITEDEVDTTLAQIGVTLRREGFRATAWFKNCCSDMSFTRLRRIVRWDREAIGWGCMELIPDGWGRLQRLGYIPAHSVRPLVDDGELVEIVEPNPVTPLSQGREIRVHRRMPRYVQQIDDQVVYFCTPGDPRVISRTTGKVYADEKALAKEEGKEAKRAHALLWFSQHSPTTPCPPPRWIGNLLRVLGSREADETNYFHLHNKTMSGGILFVFGGSVPRGTKERLERALSNELQGTENTSRILVVEAVPASKVAPNQDRLPQPSMHFESMRDNNIQDALFTEYDMANADSIGASFRLSPILRGRTPSDLNRATAEAALQFGEQQVFQPERLDFDWAINRVVMPLIGVTHLAFVSNAPPSRSPEEVGELVKATAPYGGLVPAEIRTLLSKALGIPLEKISEDWTQVPMPMTLAGVTANGGAAVNQDPTQQRLMSLEQRVADIAQAELRALGIDATIETGFLPDGSVGGEGEEPDGTDGGAV